MANSLNNILNGVKKSKVIPGSTGDDPAVDYAEKSKDGRDFVAKHKVEKHEDRVGNGDDVYNASKIKQSKDTKHGHTPEPKSKAAYKQHNEAKDTREYDYEGEMAISQIKSIMNHSEQLMGMLKPDTNLPEWVQSKITLAKDYIQTAADYFATEMSEETSCSSDDQPMYDGKKKKGRQLLNDKKLKEENDYEVIYKRQKKNVKASSSSEAQTKAEKEFGLKPKFKHKGMTIAPKTVKEEELDEREMTAADKKKEEKLKSKYDSSGMKASMQKQYGAEKGKEVYFAYIRKKAMKNESDNTTTTSSGAVGDTGRV